MNDLVRVENTGRVQVIRFDRPENQNALTGVMLDAASDALILGDEDPKIRCFLVAGTPGAFTAGLDVAEYREFQANGAVSPHVVRFMKTIATVDKPLVAAVDGLALGIGTTLLLHCDFVVASEWAAFSVPSAEIGVPPDSGASLLAPLAFGRQLAFELLVMGETFDAQRAREIGLVNRVVTPEVVEDTAFAAANRIAERPPEAIRATRLLMRGDRRDVVNRINAEAGGFADLQRSREARDAFEDFIRRNI